jgi:hypothetical protein
MIKSYRKGIEPGIPKRLCTHAPGAAAITQCGRIAEIGPIAGRQLVVTPGLYMVTTIR